jgi:hypothetical protein
MIKPFYECEYCGKKLSTQAKLDKHTCEPKKRHETLKTKTGSTAFGYYVYWMNKLGRRVTKKETFIASRFFHPFVKLVKFARGVGMPEPKFYIDYMIEKELPPNLWLTEQLYMEYFKLFDEIVPPKKLASATIKTLSSLASIFECDIKDVIFKLEPIQLIQLINERKLTPWILLLSPSFLRYMRTVADAQDRIMLDSIVDASRWAERFKNDPETTKLMKSLINDLGL